MGKGGRETEWGKGVVGIWDVEIKEAGKGAGERECA